ncbi:MAG TPA: hypothetical protein VHN39_06595, partial [Phenylobacterium sp.]|nr:hypothetical protein [Phenylobacterium sp.]
NIEQDRKQAKALRPADAIVERTIIFRYVVGAFVVRIPVSTGEKMLVPEQITLSIMKWRLDNLSPGNRWAPVLKRYIEYCSARLNGIGGDADAVPPSLTWHPPIPGKGKGDGGGREHEHEREVCGKVAEVLFDCHGAFEGFVLEDCCEPRLIRCQDRGLGELVLLACRENLTLCVRLCRESDRVEGVAIRG